MKEELVVLVDEFDTPIGTMPKSEVHGEKTPLHRAFSCFLFNSKGQLLLQQRSSAKKTWPLIWSNSCCGHPLPNELRIDAVLRRLDDELNIQSVYDVHMVAKYRYCFSRFGVMENEICPIFVGFYDYETEPDYNPDEVEDTKWINFDDFVIETENNPQDWSEWCVEETQILKNDAEFRLWLKKVMTLGMSGVTRSVQQPVISE
jgi:isopentenyl-diphosphate delta-isomerase